MPQSYQILLSEQEKARLAQRVEDDFLTAKGAHQRRIERWRGYMQRWENRVDPPKKGKERLPNHTVPLIQWQSFNKLARDMQSVLGSDAEMTARATGPSDVSLARKVGCYMTSRLFDQMQITKPFAVHAFRRILFGRSIIHRPWVRKEYDILERGQRKRACYYEGPDFIPEEPDNIVMPAERGVLDIQEFSFVIRRRRVTPDELARGDGTLYQGTADKEFLAEAIRYAQNGYNDFTMSNNPVQDEKEESEGVEYDYPMASRRGLWLWEWYGYWRPLKKRGRKGDMDAEVHDLAKREDYEADWIVRYIPGMKRIVGVQDLLELYPKMRRRRPFSDSALVADGSYWSPGFGQLLEALEDEATATSRLFAAAGELAVWPLIFYRPQTGMQAKTMRLEPGMGVPCEDPHGVNVINLQPKLDQLIAKVQEALSNAERVTGITDQSLGRSIERPNAPRTATGQLALIEEGNIRAYLDATILREDMERFASEIWEMDCDLAPKKNPGLFFRVTEESAAGAFDVRKGGAFMTPQEFGGTYDFRLKFATSVWAREARAQKILTFYNLALANPLVATNPHALWTLLNQVARELDIKDFASLIPEPPKPDTPRQPKEEWTLMLEGDADVHPNPQDHDDTHLTEHQAQLEEWRADPNRDEQAGNFLIRHLMETAQQKRTKMLMQTLTNGLMRTLATNTPETGGLQMGGVPVGLQELQQQIQSIYQPEQPQSPEGPQPQPGGMA